MACVLGLLAAGCSSPKTVANLEGKGTKQTFNYSYDNVWRAAVDAAQQGELQVINADRERGYISARRGVQVETFGENVGIWVRSLGPAQTQVEVASRQAGPPVMWLKNWENEILRAVAANVTREAVGATGTGTQIYRDTTVVTPSATVVTPPPQERTTVVIPEPRPNTTVVVPEPRPGTTVVVPDTRSTIDVRRETELRLEELRRQQREHESALAAEQNERRRQEISAEIDRLRAELRTQEQRLSELEREVK
jgi:hypothetical protein